MTLGPSFLELVQPLWFLMAASSFNTLVAILAGRVFHPHRTVTGMILAAAVVGTEHRPLDYLLETSVRPRGRSVGE
jgi:hypothetical protein